MLHLPGSHPLRRLLYSGEIGNHRIAEEMSNHLVNEQGLAKHILSWSKAGFKDLLELGSTVWNFHEYQTLKGMLGRILPEGRAKRMFVEGSGSSREAGTSAHEESTDSDLDQIANDVPLAWAPVLDQLRDWWLEMDRFVAKYIDVAYSNSIVDKSVKTNLMYKDPALRKWYAHVRQMILLSDADMKSHKQQPLVPTASIKSFSRRTIIDLAISYLWTSSVYHEVIGASIVQITRNPFQVSSLMYLDITGRHFYEEKKKKQEGDDNTSPNNKQSSEVSCPVLNLMGSSSSSTKNSNVLKIITPSLIQSQKEYEACLPYQIASRGETVTHNIVAAVAMLDDGPKMAKDWSHFSKGIVQGMRLVEEQMVGGRRSSSVEDGSEKDDAVEEGIEDGNKVGNKVEDNNEDNEEQDENKYIFEHNPNLERDLEDLWLERYWRLVRPEHEPTWIPWTDEELWERYFYYSDSHFQFQ